MSLQPATTISQVSPHLYHWSSYHPAWKVTFDSFALVSPDAIILVDPIQPDVAVLDRIHSLGPVGHIFLTNAHHDRAAGWFRTQWGIAIHAHQEAQPACETSVDFPFDDHAVLPGGVTAIPLHGSAPGSVALFSESDGGILLVGDAILHDPAKGLELLPDKYCLDPARARQSLLQLLHLNFAIMGFAHGTPLGTDAKNQIASFFRYRIY
jgi:glyoxylase-like metal-dependent hydrolase (beta-lactamase superfamily II)